MSLNESRDKLTVAVFLQHPLVDAWTFLPRNRDRFLKACPQAELIVCSDEPQFMAALPQAQVAIAWRFHPDWFRLAPALRWLATPAAGKEYFPAQAPEGVAIIHGSFHGELIAETVLGLMLGHCRGLFAAARLQQASWPRRELAEQMAPLRGSHVVILGLGNIGRWIGRLCKPFGVRLTGIRRTSPNPSNAGERDQSVETPFWDSQDRVLAISAIDSVIPQADHLVLALPGGTETDGLMNARRLALLPPQAAIYNVGRGNAIDEPALAQALRARRIAAAYLDVFASEPLPQSSPLRNCPGAFLLPHVSSAAPNYLDLFIDQLARTLNGPPPAPPR
jgi:phosphoglycerate dehydrogenase-like enzyme